MTRPRRLQLSQFSNGHKPPRGPDGRPRCRWCRNEVPRRRRTYCSAACVHEWRLRSDPGYVRDQVFIRDRGVCQACGTDAGKLYRILNYVRRRHRGHWAIKRYIKSILHDIGFGTVAWPRTLWDADHIVPVVEGGGQCGLENFRTLCIACHKLETSRLRIRRRRTAGIPSPTAEVAA